MTHRMLVDGATINGAYKSTPKISPLVKKHIFVLIITFAVHKCIFVSVLFGGPKTDYTRS